MYTLGITSYVALWGLVLLLGFLLVGILRNLRLLHWRLDQLEATTPRYLGRSGIKIGHKAPDFTLPTVSGEEVSLHDFIGCKVLLVFTQNGCTPCQRIIPALHRLACCSGLQVLVIDRRDPNGVPRVSFDGQPARFATIFQEGWEVSRRYKIFATPFAFLVSEKGIVVSKGIVNNARHIRFLLEEVKEEKSDEPAHETLAGVGSE